MITLLSFLITIILSAILFILYKYVVLIVEEEKDQARVENLRIKWEQEKEDSRIKAEKYNKKII